jgi:Fic family protein
MDSSDFGKFTYKPAKRAENKPTVQLRNTLNSVFAGLQISQKEASPTKFRERGIANALANSTIGRNVSWPQWGSVSRQTGTPVTEAATVDFTIRMSTGYDVSASSNDPGLPEILFQQATELLQDIRKAIRNSPDTFKALKEATTEALMTSIFSSNYIERVGLGLDETLELCRPVLEGGEVSADETEERSEECKKQLNSFVGAEIPGMEVRKGVVRSQREVIQHAKAMDYLIRNFVLQNLPLTEEMLKETHRILTLDIDNYHSDGTFTPSKCYGGVYRKIPVSAGSTCFAVPRAVPKLMAQMVEAFNKDIRNAEEAAVLDPFFLAAKYSDQFVQIHPFEDGNGRLSRLILNVVLIKYAGITIAIGGEEEGRREYLDVMRRSSEHARGGEELSGLVLQKSVDKLNEFKAALKKNIQVKGKQDLDGEGSGGKK